MGKITRINKDNFLYFDGLLEDRFYERKKDELFVGLINDEDQAVSAAVFSVFEDGLTLRHIATDPEMEGRGYATELLTSTIEAMKDSTFSFFQAVMYGAPEGDEAAVERVLLKAGFIAEELEAIRSVYALKDFKDFKAKAPVEGVQIKAAKELNTSEYMSLVKIEKRYEDTAFYVDADKFSEDEYCFFATRSGEILAMAHGENLQDSILIDAIFAEGKNLLLLPNLFEQIHAKAIKEYSEETPVYIDTAGDKIFEYQMSLVGKDAAEKLTGRRFVVKNEGV